MTESDLQCRECSVCPHSLWYLSSLRPHIGNENCVTVASCSTGEGGGERGAGTGGRGWTKEGEKFQKGKEQTESIHVHVHGENRGHTCMCT